MEIKKIDFIFLYHITKELIDMNNKSNLDLSINIIIFKNIFEYQYSEFDKMMDAMQLSHANDMKELIDASKELYELIRKEPQNVDENIKAVKRLKPIFEQYRYPINTWLWFYSANF